MGVDEERSLLGSAMVLCVRRWAYSDERVLEINDVIVPADRYELEYTWQAT